MMLFRRADYSVAAAPNAQEAIHCLQQCRFDLVILDLKLPDAHGLCLLPQILERFPGLPVIILTGDDSVSTTLDAIRLGATGYLVKPVEPRLILDCAERVSALG
jgi:DNA-binding NtrC family response regulator